MKYRRPSPEYPINWNRLRFVVFKRDNFICQICGRRCRFGVPGLEPHCHHIKPVSLGGSHTLNNLITVCEDCHRRIHHLENDI